MTVNVKQEGHVLLIEIDRPKKYNALTREMYHQIAHAYWRLDQDPELRVGLVYGLGAHFSAGLELTDWTDTFGGGEGFPSRENEIDPFYINDGPRCSKPVIMAVQGYTYTWAVESMLNTDIRVAATDTRFAMLEVRRGLFPCGGATLRLHKEIGWANAQRYLLTGDEWFAEDAYRWGLVQHLTEPGKQFEKAFEIAQRVATAAPLGVKGVLQNCRKAVLEGEEAARKVIFKELAPVMQSEDMKEGLQSFIERRAAVFKGK
ncbi:MAG TPA: crotonase/enoyl-CoA hydratase family protein [Pseudomonadales bacterium]|nr:crotonase/enoyl-CoA hydratase family protein [Pseudomonadales bacterium]